MINYQLIICGKLMKMLWGASKCRSAPHLIRYLQKKINQSIPSVIYIYRRRLLNQIVFWQLSNHNKNLEHNINHPVMILQQF